MTCSSTWQKFCVHTSSGYAQFDRYNDGLSYQLQCSSCCSCCSCILLFYSSTKKSMTLLGLHYVGCWLLFAGCCSFVCTIWASALSNPELHNAATGYWVPFREKIECKSLQKLLVRHRDVLPHPLVWTNQMAAWWSHELLLLVVVIVTFWDTKRAHAHLDGILLYKH